MDWIKKMNEAVDYIEARLDGEIDLGEVAQIAHCSAYHFQRVFSYMAGITLTEYIRRRRLTKAAVDLQSGNDKVIDIALKYGYESPTAFSRAFQGVHGMTPTEARQTAKSFKSYPPISFQITIKGVTAMEYRIEQREAFRVVGVKIRTTMKDGAGYKEIPEFWAEAGRNGTLEKIASLIGAEPFGVLGISACENYDMTDFDYYLAAATSKPVPPGMEEYTVPASQWAIFESVGPMPDAIQELQKRIITEWLPSSGYTYAAAPDIEVYPGQDIASPDYKSYVWFPITKK